MVKAVAFFLLAINTGNIWTAIGNDISCQLISHELSGDKLQSVTVWMIGVGSPLSVVILCIVYCSKLERHENHGVFHEEVRYC